MNQQDQIVLLAAALEEVGKMPEWIGPLDSGVWNKPCLAIREDGTSETVAREDAVLAALGGVAEEFIAEHGLAVLRREGCGECFDREDREDRDDCPDCGGTVVYEIIEHNWMTGSYVVGMHENRIEALASAVRVAGKGEKQ